MRHYDLSPLFRSTVGFDRLNQLFETAFEAEERPSYPPYDIEKLAETTYQVTMAVAGFQDKDITITFKPNQLIVQGKIEDKGVSGRTYLYRGIAGRAFERRFQLADHVEVKGAKLDNGLLRIDLALDLPEAMRTRQIPVNGGAKVIETKAA
ncbi:MAG: Hsp20 family protein [Alphaproteobacteria bacterium]|nr:Hsp20 family protein [Alphaproteobacteria bacterium]